MLTLDDFDYPLPPERIAQAPLAQRSASRLLVMSGPGLEDRSIPDLPGLLLPGDLLVMNDTRVLHARLLGRKDSGGAVEVLVERSMEDATEVLAQVRASKPPKPGSRLLLEDALTVEVLGREGEFYRLRFPGDAQALIEIHGRLPLPPYIDRTASDSDESRYQTVFARERGSVAAPTAGLHFDQILLDNLQARGIATTHVTLHVGAGTFQPVRVHKLSEHRMHRERWQLPQATVDAITACRARGGRVVAVGTTSLRTLESAVLAGELRAAEGETDLFVTPGFQFRVVDLLLTNFHLPKSTLLMLVSAFGGMDRIRAAYRHAIEHEYRFFSYGDAMLIHRNPEDAI
ncbi:tRNA preQ1(34) S-adenosylmethionine ribosyltransferase-isomerase QueA [Denitratisoma oestradiolicum]|uniref:S-adenosylmethionine:tRNA ribosyltransferase-isomerase n=1 Tax=Denitratisoma oestradiolicum TaxID=311182 RepID=A0A6S6YBM9_9PROT|nr:tRNA preQ1(34) S-adenosylmethionine ribosyltransferase-isomerase QueA [Denitratisoma oestradiolicum]TWO80127.1 tRNA preQ1(34) S-adenosylmethionine ribosyltransferase-isomerase QueA [Denitratisoma oestradiolicum]CAB1370036.1 S-adenosylmethionine:tRNA ribosyltransferase-isomerase [Denitratisoma oestradiolicum]